MRPLRLEIKGLRSFRAEVEIGFRDLGLVAIVGDTGAGKSSILEAITYALYNATTWDQRGVKQLISDGASTMTVQFDFACDGQTYRITRSTSRTAYPPPGHELECLSNPSVPKLDGEEAIKKEVTRLVGLGWDGFTSAVILPQGRFQTLLQASPAERTDILKGIFRLHELGVVRDHAQRLAGEYRGSLDDLLAERAQLLPDPKQAAREAAGRKAESEEEEAKLRAVKGQVAEQEEAAKDKTETAGRLRAAASLVEEANSHPAAALAELQPLLAELDDKAVALTREEQELQKADGRARDALGRAEGAGESEAALSRAQAVLKRFTTESPRLAAEAKRHGQERRALADAQEQLATDEEALESLSAAAVEKVQARDAAEESVQQAAGALQKAKDGLSEYRRLAEEAARAAAARADIEAEQQQAGGQLEEARTAEAQAHENASAAAAALAQVQREHAAAHAADGLRPGDPCPICGHAVPAGFKPPRAPAEQAAKKAHEHATASETKARDARAKLEERCRQLGESVNAARERSKTASDAEKTTLRRLRKALGDTAADPSVADEQLLAALTSRVEGQQEALQLARRQAEEARSAATGAEAALKPRQTALGERRQTLERDEATHAEQTDALEAERAALPERFRPAANASADRTQVLLARLEARLEEVRGLRGEREGFQQRLTELRADRDELAERRQRQFDEPRQEAEKTVLLLHERLRDATGLAGLETPPLPEAGGDFASYAAAVAALEQTAENIVKTIGTRAGEADGAADKARAEMVRLLKKVEAADTAELEELLIAAAAAARQAKAEEALARAQIPKVAALEKKLGPLRDAIGTLEALASELTDGRFIGFVVARRQRALLGIASEILGSMTGKRYGFAEDFKIIDRISGQPRGAKTLSGGESFLASLALALGLVELAARSGGRLEALFLDEGFGSLDADALQEALGELERRADAGRLVAVISHVRAVAEQIETVLRVNYRPEGSEVLRVTGAEREAFITEEVEQGLLA
ncbi:MAG TPA: SMC family ATPase [Gaiellaceae bacterium]|nr:SMC family ATPase [Gaiellaceae bacterium]